MLKKLFKKEKPTIYLGELTVAPRKDLKRIFDEWSLTQKIELGSELFELLKGMIQLPLASEVKSPNQSELAVDIAISKHQLGYLDSLNGSFPIPIFWRPSISMTARLRSLSTDVVMDTFYVTKKMPWSEYFRSYFSLKALFQIKLPFDQEDMELLLLQASQRLIQKVQRSKAL